MVDNDDLDLDNPIEDFDELLITADNNGELKIHTPYIQDYILHGNDLCHLSLCGIYIYDTKNPKK
jgi:hypothetical protein